MDLLKGDGADEVEVFGDGAVFVAVEPVAAE